MQGCLNVAATFSMMGFNSNNGIAGIQLCGALFALSPAPASRNNESGCIGKDDLTWFWMFHFVLTQSSISDFFPNKKESPERVFSCECSG
jgi:hypothetical protein